MRAIAVVNQKGGVGKTTTTINLGAALTKLGKRVLLVDLDPQAHLTYGLGLPAHELKRTIYDVLQGEAKAKKAIVERDGLAVLPSTSPAPRSSSPRSPGASSSSARRWASSRASTSSSSTVRPASACSRSTGSPTRARC